MITVRSAYEKFFDLSSCSVGWVGIPLIGVEGCFFESNYPSFNRRVGPPDYNSGSELEQGPVRVRGRWSEVGVGVAWVKTGDACATVIPHSYIPPEISVDKIPKEISEDVSQGKRYTHPVRVLCLAPIDAGSNQGGSRTRWGVHTI